MPDGNSALTTRRTFIGALTATVFSLAGLWEVLGLGSGHGHGGPSMSAAEFDRRVERFVDRYRGADGVVEPPRASEVPPELQPPGGAGPTAPVYLRAQRFSYTPGELRLHAGVPYTFYMMAMDVAHGASINTPDGSVMHRLLPHELVEATVTVYEPGTYLLYCSYYCGAGHPDMSATLHVVEA